MYLKLCFLLFPCLPSSLLSTSIINWQCGASPSGSIGLKTWWQDKTRLQNAATVLWLPLDSWAACHTTKVAFHNLTYKILMLSCTRRPWRATRWPLPRILQDPDSCEQQSQACQQKLLLCTHQNIVFARELVLPGTNSTRLLMDNLHYYSVLNNLPFEEKAIHWYYDLLLIMTWLMTRWALTIESWWHTVWPSLQTNGIFQLDLFHAPSHFMKETSPNVREDDTHEVMRGQATDWMDSGV